MVFPYDLQWKEVEKAETWIQRNGKWKRGNTLCFICKEPQEAKEGGREVGDEHS